MRYLVHYFSIIICAVVLACGGAAEESSTTPEPIVSQPMPPPQVQPEPQPEAPPRQQPIQRVAPLENTSKCGVYLEEDGTNMVVSDDHDWFFYVERSAQVECGNVGGRATVVDGPLTIKIKALIPSSDSGTNMEVMLREKAVGYIKNELNEKYGTGSQLVFKESKLGRSKRPALCVDEDLNLNGEPGRVVSCVTSKKNINDEIVVHRVVWVGKKEEYDSKKTVKTVKQAAASWFRYSDTDGMGKLRIKW